MEYRVDSWWEAHPSSQQQVFKVNGQLQTPLEYEAVLGTLKARFRAGIWELILSLSPSLCLRVCPSVLSTPYVNSLLNRGWGLFQAL